MNLIMLVKTVPAIALAGYALSKGFPMRAKSPSPSVTAQPMPEMIRGKVQDVMSDKRYHYALIENGTDAHFWVGARSGEVSIGQEVACRPDRVVEHFENAELRMVLEKVYFTDQFLPQNQQGPALG